MVARVVEDLKDESEPYRRMVMETIDKVVRDLGSADIDARLEELLIDGILYAFQEQACTPRFDPPASRPLLFARCSGPQPLPSCQTSGLAAKQAAVPELGLCSKALEHSHSLAPSSSP